MKELVKMSRTCGFLEKLYRLLNERYFENALTMPVITVQSSPNAYGHISTWDLWSRGNGTAKELNLGAGTLRRPIEEVTATLLHEMVHQYCSDHGIKDTSRNGTYHNKRFKEEAEKRDLIIECHDKYGWTITRASDNLIQFCLDNDLSEILLNRDSDLMMGLRGIAGAGESGKANTPLVSKVKKPSSTRKYQCPKCGMSVRATKEVNIICGDCHEHLLPV